MCDIMFVAALFVIFVGCIGMVFILNSDFFDEYLKIRKRIKDDQERTRINKLFDSRLSTVTNNYWNDSHRLENLHARLDILEDRINKKGKK